MSLDTVNAAGVEEGLARWASNPGPEPEPGFNAVSFLSAGAKGIPSAVMEFGASAMDAMSGPGNILAATGGSAGGMFATPTEQEQKQEAAARERMLKDQNFSTEEGNKIRRKAAEFAPDPLVSHKADQVMHGLVRFGTKAVGSVGLFGGPAGALLMGLEEGNTVTQDLRTKGIDDATAVKVGAVQGGLAAAGVVMPLAGKTLPQTLGLIGVGGPGSYMAQESLAREILQSAGYQDEASLHNPFDPLGLTLSTVIPGGFGAFHMRGIVKRAEAVKGGTTPLEQMTAEELRSLKYNDTRLDSYASQVAEKYGVPPALLLAIKNVGEKSDPTAVSPRGAKGVMQFMPGTAKEMGLADPTDPVASIDAGARYLKKLYDAYGSWDAAVAHYNGGGNQAAIVRGGGRPTYKETAGYLDRVQKYMQEQTAVEASKVPEAVDAARVAVLNDTLTRSLPDTPDAVGQVQRASEIVGESSGRVAEVDLAPTERVVEIARLESELREVEAGMRAMVAAPLEVPNQIQPLVRQFFDEEGLPIGRSYDQMTPEERAAYDLRQGIPPGRREEVDVIHAREHLQMLERRVAAARSSQKELDMVAGGLSEYKAADVLRTADADLEAAQLNLRGAELRSELARQRAAPLPRPGEREQGAYRTPGVRESDNSLPPPDSVALDEPVKRGAAGGGEPTLFAPKTDGKSLSIKGKSGGAEGAAELPSIDQQLAQKLATEQPDLQVILPGDEAPISLSKAMERIAEEQKQDAQWAELVRVAAECALAG